MGSRWQQFGRFNLVGLLGAVLQLLVYYLVMRTPHLPEAAASAIAVEIAVLHNFFWHERFTWRDRGPAALSYRALRLWRFHVGNGLVSLTGNALVTYVLVERLGAPSLPSAVAAIAFCAPANFFLADRWVYAQPQPVA
jgi:putative flippase GtrA